MTYLELVNECLTRLRENTVTTVGQSIYSRLIALYVNDSKRQVEDAWNWSVLDASIPVVTIAGTSEYTLVGSGIRQKDVTANITSTGYQTPISAVPAKWIQNQQQLTTTAQSSPVYYAWAGNNGTDSKIEVFPTPNGAYTIMFNMTATQANLSLDADILLVPSEPVIAGAVARALVERGEDGGLASSEAYSLFKGILSDYIALEQARDVGSDCWVAT